MPVSDDKVKIAVKMPGQDTCFYGHDRSHSIDDLIKYVCHIWKLSVDTTQYGIQREDNLFYVTDTKVLQNGCVLNLVKSPLRMAKELLDKIRTGDEINRLQSLIRLAKQAADIVFANEFINIGGFQSLKELTINTGLPDAIMASTLSAYQELIELGIIPWENVTNPIIVHSLIGFVKQNNKNKVMLQRSLEILELVTMNCVHLYTTVASEMSLDILIELLQDEMTEIRENGISLINALCRNAPTALKKQELHIQLRQRRIRNSITANILCNNESLGTEMNHQLYLHLALMFNTYRQRAMTPGDPQSQTQRDSINELRQIAFETLDSTPRQGGGYSEHYTKLGFTDTKVPANDFSECPPGVLALDLMLHFARYQTEAYTKIVLENSRCGEGHECPFTKACIKLVAILCEILHVHDEPMEMSPDFQPMFYTHDHPFEEFFCISIQLLNKTWKEMRATNQDFEKVLAVVKDQVVRKMAEKPLSMDHFRTIVFGFGWTQILKVRRQERAEKEYANSRATPVVQLRKQITPEILDIIKEQRLSYLMEGQLFKKATGNRKDREKYCYCKLSHNGKVLYFGDTDGQNPQPVDNLREQVAISDILDVVTGKDCQFKEKKRGTEHGLPFSIKYDMDTSLNIITNSQTIFDIWTDGLNVLRDKPMMSDLMEKDLETLLSMEMKLRLLDTENVPIPETPPEIPPPPDNFDFVYDYST